MKLHDFLICLSILKKAQDRENRIGTTENPVVLSKDEERELRKLGWFTKENNP